MKQNRKVNYHTHTTRCAHATGSDESYVESALQGGYTELGFSDHSPWPYASGYRPTMRMQIEELDGYVQSVKALAEKYEGKIRIDLALECEYFPDYIDWLRDMARHYRMDYLLYGGHFYPSDEAGNYYGAGAKTPHDLNVYAESSARALESGLFAYFAHPDLFMRGQPGFGANERAVSRQLCRMANSCHRALEYNLAGLLVSRQSKRPGYPCKEFWKIAAQEGCTAIIGVDAHSPRQLESDVMRVQAAEFLRQLGITVTDTIPKFDWSEGKHE